jgi:hypothetical protein
MTTIPFTGIIKTTSQDGTSALVLIETAGHTSFKYAVISSDTVGCVTLMNGNGRLQPGVRVRGSAEQGSEALRAVSVELLEKVPA